jgi:hypothetical protein
MDPMTKRKRLFTVGRGLIEILVGAAIVCGGCGSATLRHPDAGGGTGDEAGSAGGEVGGQAGSTAAGVGGQSGSVATGVGGQSGSTAAGVGGQSGSVGAGVGGQSGSVGAGVGGQSGSVSAGVCGPGGVPGGRGGIAGQGGTVTMTGMAGRGGVAGASGGRDASAGDAQDAATCVANYGKTCGSCGGTYTCSGSCSVATPSNYGQTCGSCGGTYTCSGSCSVATPSNYGQTCGSCGGTYTCSGSCSVATPTNYGQSCNCGGTYQCNGNCSASPCPTYGQISFDITTGSDDLRQDSSATAGVAIGGAQQSFTLKAQNAAGWNNNAENVVTVTFGSQEFSAFGSTVITLTSHNSGLEGDDNWNIQSIKATLIGSSGNRCLFSVSGNPFARLTGSGPSVTIAAGSGC